MPKNVKALKVTILVPNLNPNPNSNPNPRSNLIVIGEFFRELFVLPLTKDEPLPSFMKSEYDRQRTDILLGKDSN